MSCVQADMDLSAHISREGFLELNGMLGDSEGQSANLERVVQQKLGETELLKLPSPIRCRRPSPMHDEIHAPEPLHDQEVCIPATTQNAEPEVQEAPEQNIVFDVLPDGTIRKIITTYVSVWQSVQVDPSASEVPNAYYTDGVLPWSTQASDDILIKGMSVRLQNLQVETEFNGREGACEGWDAHTKCWIIRFENGDRKAVSCDNLIIDASPPQVHTVQVQRPTLQPPSLCDVCSPVIEVATALQTAPATHQAVATCSRPADHGSQASQVTKLIPVDVQVVASLSTC
eukprot:gnl/TRDRNA2_/TRDRNA2_155059_c0_seq1.p1 gnl/TRDRNA2_/TRDRNA2_155059_c0~~gnl/TRDRNA2_/TRDRNA2_155059_c0_seq1.p1  ORF type:complete len:287 (-),score=33.13 gnl/TRDRNA2_/TRDRNA2_155059_c0_seq1:295-1155(-)